MESSRSLTSLASVVQWTEPFRPEHCFQEKDLFIAGLDDVNIYRIPALLATAGGTLLAFCEARERDDCDPLDLVLKRSIRSDKNLQGVNAECWPDDRKWLPMQVVVPGRGDAPVNPCPVLDRTTGTVWLCCRMAVGGLARNLETVSGPLLMLSSADEGATWSAPVAIDAQVGYFLPGPGVGVQLRSGRLVIPGYDEHSAKVIYSDDHGHSWKAGQAARHPANESQAVELADGTLALNMRIEPGCRYVALSRDGGQTWCEEHREEALPDPACMASIGRYSWAGSDGGRSRLLFANPALPASRTQLVVKLSYDEGKTWPVARTITPGPAAYSCLAGLDDGTIGLLYETGDQHPYERIRFARFSLEWLSEGRDRIRPASLPLELPLEWDFALDPGDVGVREGWFRPGPRPAWGRIRVDAPWTRQGHEHHGAAWYRLRFAVPDDLRPGTRLQLLFGAIDGYAQAYVDGALAAEETVSPRVMSHRPFFAPLPEGLRPGAECEVVVRVARSEGQAGVWRPVCLVERM
ncbi:MAG: exo-alpha-sialidase [Gemmatimonadota bacterium]